MRIELECPVEERYLFADELFSDELTFFWQNESTKRLREELKGTEYKKYINWKRKENQLALFTMYAYADLAVPKKFDCIFEIKKPSNFVNTKFTLVQAILEAWFPMSVLDHGHKHLCIFEFEDEIPKIIDKLHVLKGKVSTLPRGASWLGICQMKDYEEIKKAREKYL